MLTVMPEMNILYGSSNSCFILLEVTAEQQFGKMPSKMKVYAKHTAIELDQGE